MTATSILLILLVLEVALFLGGAAEGFERRRVAPFIRFGTLAGFAVPVLIVGIG